MNNHRSKKRIRFKPRFFVIMAVFLFLMFFLLYRLVSGLIDSPAEESNDEENKGSGKKVELNVTVAGDLVIHEPVFSAMRSGDTFDFKPCFKYIKKYIEPADAAICTFEGVLVNSDFSGYPLFRTPKKLAKDVRDSGFDLMTITSNHAADGGTKGFDSTINATKDAGLIPSGGQAKDEDPDYAMIEVKEGIKIAFISYSYSDGSVNEPSLNGNVLPDDMVNRCNTFTMKDKSGAVKDVRRVEKEARKAGADIVILSMHWGEEYETHSNKDQQKLAQMLADGTTCDILAASHPHVVQEFKEITSKDGKRTMPCFFAIGNLLSNQRREIINGNIHVEEGVMAMFKIEYDKSRKRIETIKTGRVPYWVNLYSDSKGTHYDIVPLKGKFTQNESLTESGNVSLAKEAKKEIERILNADKTNSGDER